MRNLSWPQFLDLLDADPDTAFADFYRFAFGTLSTATPRAIRSLNSDDRQDLIQDVIYHCVREDFHVLRQYVDKGKPFAVWLYAIAHNVCLDHFRAQERNPDVTSVHEDASGTGLENVLSDRHNHSQNKPELLELVAIVKKTLGLVGEYCRLLLEMAADEFTPKEMALVLGMPSDQNKKVSDDLRYCRKKLRNRLAETGIDIESLLKT
jgi:RNA polymerase sigma factor (sigma-70 family)